MCRPGWARARTEALRLREREDGDRSVSEKHRETPEPSLEPAQDIHGNDERGDRS